MPITNDDLYVALIAVLMKLTDVERKLDPKNKGRAPAVPAEAYHLIAEARQRLGPLAER